MGRRRGKPTSITITHAWVLPNYCDTYYYSRVRNSKNTKCIWQLPETSYIYTGRRQQIFSIKRIPAADLTEHCAQVATAALDIIPGYYSSRNLFERRSGGSVAAGLLGSERRGSIFAISGSTEEAGVLVPDRPHDSREASVLSIEDVSLQVK